MAKKAPKKSLKDKLNAAYVDMKKKDRKGGCNCNGEGTCQACRSCGQ
jgi:hypothetical protein